MFKQSGQRLFENWEQQILRPVVVSLLTALLLFAGSLAFSPVRRFFFPPSIIEDYPLMCTAEPYVDGAGDKLLVDFFIINRKGEDYDREKLIQFLRAANVNPGLSLSPDIILQYARAVGRIERAFPDEEFNDAKGELVIDPKGQSVEIRLKNIIQRAVLKATIVIVDVPELQAGTGTIKRAAKSSVPFGYQKYEQGCYSR